MKLKKIIFILLAIVLICTSVVWATEVQDETMPSSETDAISEVDEELENLDVDKSLLIEGSKYIMPRGGVEDVDGPAVDNDYFAVDQNLELKDKVIDGNLFIICQDAEITNVQVSGSVFAIAGEIKFTNVTSNGSLYIVTEDCTTSNSNFKNIYSVSQNISLKEGTFLQKNLYALAQKCMFNANVGRDAGILGETVEIGNTAVVNENLMVSAATEPKVPESADIGNYTYTSNESSENSDMIKTGFDITTSITAIISFIAITMIVAFIVLKAMPTFEEKIKEYTVGKYFVNAALGLLFIILIPIIAILLMCTGILSKIGIVLLLAYVVLLLLASSITTVGIGIYVAKTQGKTERKDVYVCVLITSAIIAVLAQVPVIGAITLAILGLSGVGTAIVLPLSKNKKTE